MSRCKCDWSAEHTADAFRRITPITRDEETQIDGMFRTYLIVEVQDRRTKSIYCTSCRQMGDFVKPSKFDLGYDPHNDFADYYNMKHGDQTHCPFCGNSAEVVYAGKMRGLCKKMYQSVQVVVFHAETDGWLSAVAVRATKNYVGMEWNTQVQFDRYAAYLFRPGCALQRVYKYEYVNGAVQLVWVNVENIYEPFRARMNDWWTGHDHREYIEIGLEECLKHTDMRYSAADLFVCDRESDFGLMRYLGEYCHRPQLEMLNKLGLDDILRELIYCRRSNSRLINWRAADLPGFLRLDKRHSKLFMQSKHKTVQELELVQILQKENVGVQDETEVLEFLNRMQLDTVLRLREAIGSYPFMKVLRYLMKHENTDAVLLWIDYIRMAKDLEYDLSEDTVFLPKDLKARHDAAAETIKLKRNEILMKKYKRRYKKLCQMYEFTDGEFTIVVPATMDDIIAEGRVMHHCVGSYANRHANGETTILFLRKNEQPDQPYGTIEMSVIDNARVIQLRGYRNNDVPKKESKQFIAVWTEWIAAGSPRDQQGNPIIEKTKEEKVAV